MTRHCQSAAEKDPIFTYRDFEAFQVEFRRTTHVRVEIVVVKHVPNLRRTCGNPPIFAHGNTLDFDLSILRVFAGTSLREQL